MGLKRLIQKCKRRDIKAQSEIYHLFAGKMFGLCLKYSRNKQEAEDNLQDAFITIFDKIDQFKFKGSFEGWMKRIVINTVLQTYRQKNVLNLVENDLPDEVDVEVDEEDISLDYLLKIIQELPERYRMVFNLYVLDGYSHKEISDLLGIAEGTSKSNLSRARLILKEKIEMIQQQKNVGLFN
ncbi:MAG: RNA polymerase subunit sigma-70 [Flavobacteriia bacterium]|nr:MAG: RNA polymerase subunit sigma-70 [Flavobacteriia bacterium]